MSDIPGADYFKEDEIHVKIGKHMIDNVALFDLYKTIQKWGIKDGETFRILLEKWEKNYYE